MLRKVPPLYITSIVVIAGSLAFYALLQLTFRYDREQIQAESLSLTIAAQLETGLAPEAYEALESEVESIHGVSGASVHVPVPPWMGEPDREEGWIALWQTYLPPILTATPELHISQVDEVPRIANQIQSLSGVADLAWDEDIYRAQTAWITKVGRGEPFLSGVFWVFLFLSSTALIYSFPNRMRRETVIRTALRNLRSIDPDSLMREMLIGHAGISAVVFIAVFTLGYLFFPLPLQTGGSPNIFWMQIKYAFIAALFSAGVCAIGWWLGTENGRESITIRPEMISEGEEHE